MKKNPINFNNTYVKLPPLFYSEVQPSMAPNPVLLKFNHLLASDLDLAFESTTETELAKIFSGVTALAGAQPLAMVYSGHQFGHFSPQLGDGRAILLGEVIAKDGLRYDIQLKGSGQTPYSRRGDGKAWLGPVIREYLVSEAMNNLGVPTTRALAVALTGETVYREQPLPGGVITRVASSHIRFGTFEYFSSRKDSENLSTLLEYSIKRHYPQLSESSDRPLDFFKEVLKGQAQLVAQWMGLGFIHGVMNTDNASIAGITIDYGPCAFMDHYKSDKVFSSIDRNGRYSYSNQPLAAYWNLARLAEALVHVYPREKKEALENFRVELEKFKEIFELHLLSIMSKKIGLATTTAEGSRLIKLWLNYLEKNNLDFTLSFRNLAKTLEPKKFPKSPFEESEQWNKFYREWSDHLKSQQINLAEARNLMNSHNPLYIPRNHLIEKVIKEAVEGDLSHFSKFNEVLANPFNEQDSPSELSLPPKPHEIVTQTFCGT